MITFVLAVGAAAVLFTALKRLSSETVCGLVCWTFSAIASVIAAVMYFSCCADLTVHLSAMLPVAVGVGITSLLVMALELAAPAKRLRGSRLTDYDRATAERSFNIVMVIIASAGFICASACELCGAAHYSVLGIVPAVSVSLRQLSYFMFRVKLDTLSADKGEERRNTVLRSLGSRTRRL
ncbi:MAG: hypothetical protein IJZ95_03385 [Oscillospiraceae bacterium]|nr:hypothetical protein [Oscillospiraceae bacterium]